MYMRTHLPEGPSPARGAPETLTALLFTCGSSESISRSVMTLSDPMDWNF